MATGDAEAGYVAARDGAAGDALPRSGAGGAPPIARATWVAKLLREHQRFWAALRNKDGGGPCDPLGPTRARCRRRNYLPDLDNAWRVYSGSRRWMRNPDASALKPMPTDLALEVCLPRMARSVDANRNSPIGFDERDTRLDAFIDAWFCRGGVGLGWVMIR